MSLMTHNMATNQYNENPCEIQKKSWLLKDNVDPCEEDSNLDIATERKNKRCGRVIH